MPRIDAALRTIHTGCLILTLLPAMMAMPAGAQPNAGQRATACTAADAPAGPRLAITITNARNATGKVVVTLYGADPTAFLEQRIALVEAPVQGSTAQACFALSGPGAYAVSVFHDENLDGILNRSLLGLPLEGFGFSNDAPVRLGPPSFDAARIAVPASGGAIPIRLRYF